MRKELLLFVVCIALLGIVGVIIVKKHEANFKPIKQEVPR